MSDEVERKDSEATAPARDVVLDHDYDGILEYDNPVPLWMTTLFMITVLFSVIYIPYYLLGYVLDFDTPQIELAKDLKALEMIRQASATTGGADHETTEEALLALSKDPVAVGEGKEAFTEKTCVSCHGPQGQGLIGPNLTDSYWLHGNSLMDIRNVIVNGVADKGMLAWGNMIEPQVIDRLVVYVRSIQGSNPPNAKPPQGELVE